MYLKFTENVLITKTVGANILLVLLEIFIDRHCHPFWPHWNVRVFYHLSSLRIWLHLMCLSWISCNLTRFINFHWLLLTQLLISVASKISMMMPNKLWLQYAPKTWTCFNEFIIKFESKANYKHEFSNQ